jgi:hypothetical protein
MNGFFCEKIWIIKLEWEMFGCMEKTKVAFISGSVGKPLMALLLLANIGMLVFYSFFTFKFLLSTDAATKILLANEVLNRGELLIRGWAYVNNDVWIFLNHIFLVPLIRLFGLNYLSYALNNVLFYCFYGLSIYFFVRRLTISTPLKILMAILAVSSLGHCYAIFLFGEIAYITSYIFIFLWLGLVNRVVHSDESELKKYYLSLFVLLSFFTIHNPQRALIYNLLPILSVGMSLYFMDPAQKDRYLRLCLVGLASFVCSVVFYYAVIIKDLTIIKGANNLSFANYESFLNNLNIFFLGLLDVYNLVDESQFSPFSFPGIIRLASFCFFFLIVYSFIKIPKRFDRENSDDLTALLLFGYYLFVNLFLYLFTVPLAQDQTTFRYLYPAVILSFVIMVLCLNHLRWNRQMKTAILVVLVLFLSVINYARYVRPGLLKEVNPHEHLGEYLSENGLTYGFASYWHSYVTSVFAENDALVAPISLSSFLPMTWLSSESWYSNYGVDESFIVFTNGEYNSYYDSIIKKIGRKPVRVDQLDDFKIAVFDKNIAYELNRVNRLSLEEGIHFNIKGYPEFIRETSGFSHYEPSHRWSEGKKSTLIFKEKLPESFHLFFSGTPFIVTENSSLEVMVGKDKKTVDLRAGFHSYQLEFKDVNTDKIEFLYKKPLSPFELNMSTDPRKLSFAFSSIKIGEASLVDKR